MMSVFNFTLKEPKQMLTQQTLAATPQNGGISCAVAEATHDSQPSGELGALFRL
jgi:hypothetical protein